MTFRLLRIVPSLLVLALLALVARAQTPAVLLRAGLVPMAAAVVPHAPARVAATAPLGAKPRVQLISCADGVGESVTATAQFFIQPDPYIALYQPFVPGGPLTQASFEVQLLNGTTITVTPTADLRFFDPQASDPISISYPLARGVPSQTALGELELTIDFPHSMVTRMLSDNVAQGCTATALGVELVDGASPVLLGISPQSTTVTAGYARNSQGPIDFFGMNPAFGMSACRAPIADDLLGIAQQVIRVNSIVVPSPTADLVQSFVCPVTVTVERLELAIATATASLPLRVSVYDFGNASVPPSGPLLVTATATVINADAQRQYPVWTSSELFATKPVLLAGRRYWVFIQSPGGWSLGADAQGGDPNGSMYRRSVSGTAQIDPRDLAYRIIATEMPSIEPPVSTTCTASFNSYGSCTCTAAYPVNGRGRFVQPFPAPHSLESVQVAARFSATRTVPPPDFDPRTLELRFLDASCQAPMDNTYPVAIMGPRSTVTATGPWLGLSRWGGTTMTAASEGDEFTSCGSGFALVADVHGSKDPIEILYYKKRSATETAGPGYVEAEGINLFLPGGDGGNPPIPAMESEPTRAKCADKSRAMAQCLPVENTFTLPQGALVAQSFSVTATATFERVELAIPGGSAPFTPLHISIVETPDDNPPVFGAPASVTLTASYDSQLEHAAGLWVVSDPSTVTAELLAGHHYWIVLQPDGLCPLASAGGSQSTTPGYLNGRMVVATSPTIGYEETYADLSFRLIASPVLALGVPGPIAPAQITWSLRASPNPFASSIALAWEGSSGPVSIEVLDVRGRIIRSVRPQLAGLAGTWMWRGETAAGRRAPPGVYFVRASRGGQSAVRRVTLLP